MGVVESLSFRPLDGGPWLSSPLTGFGLTRVPNRPTSNTAKTAMTAPTRAPAAARRPLAGAPGSPRARPLSLAGTGWA